MILGNRMNPKSALPAEKTKMQIKLFSIPIGADDAATEEMNHFLRANEYANEIIDFKKD